MAPIDASVARIMQQLYGISHIPPEALLVGAEVIYRHSQELVPVATGFLKRSGYIQQQGDDVQVGYDAPYASFVEFGTYKMAAQPYLRPAIDENAEEILNAVGGAVVDYMQDVISQGGGGRVSTQPNIPGVPLQP